ncbi:gliding motility-associated C-terminal domain-containing protein [Christiangramia aquimixticola]|uniref:gliding motility-associated C-terminal domain-containing protein n=1 Tax=Christiangramia aquimixticola TaxID=1697558 RepID=UPI003AA962AE
MQNFTTGRRGINWFLFTFILFVGNLTSYGQTDCPSSGDIPASQSFCYLETISDINTGAKKYPVYQTDDNATDTQPIPGNEVLTDGTTYYVGGTSATCDRVPVTVNVTATNTPDNTLFPERDNFTLSPCISSDYTVGQLKGLFTPNSGFTIKVYESEFGDDELTNNNQKLVPNASYYVGQTASGECPSTRAAVGYDPVKAPAPNAENEQTFCEGATVADLEAQGTEPNTQSIRFYRSATAPSPLASDTELIHDRTYYATQVVNNRNSKFPPCESEDRTPIKVTVIPFDAGADVSATYCQQEIEDLLTGGQTPGEIFISIFEGRPLPANVTFNPSLDQITADFNNDPTQTFNTVATFTTEDGCQDDAGISLTVTENPDAGENGSVTLNSNDAPIDLIDFLNGTPAAGGTWTPGDGTFDPAIDTAGDFKYEVTAGNCSDSAIVTVIVNKCDPPNAGNDGTGIVCYPDWKSTFPNEDALKNYLYTLLDDGVPTDGTFDPTISELNDMYEDDADGLGDFSTTYTLGTDGCTNSTLLTISVVEKDKAEAGSFKNIKDVCSNDEMIDLTKLENNDPDASKGGTFSGTGVDNNMFNPSIGNGEYTITYTVDGDTPCVTGQDETTFTISVNDAVVDTSVNRNLCITEAQDLISNPAGGYAYITSLLAEGGVTTVDPDNFEDGTMAEATRLANYINSPDSNSENFEFKYTNDSGNICEGGTVTISITITTVQDAEAGTIQDQTVCTSDGMIDLNNYLGDDSTPGGTFTGPGVTNNEFDPTIGASTDGYEITYTVDDSADCVTPGTSDSTTFKIFVNQGIEAGNSNTVDLCREDVDRMFPTLGAVKKFFLNLLDKDVNRNGTFNPTMQELITDYNENPDKDVFTTTYTLTNGTCTDTAVLTVNVYEGLPAETGTIENPAPVCKNADDIDLFSLLSDDANPNGEFEGYEDGIFSPGMMSAGDFVITYTLTEDSPCTTGNASTSFTITVLDSAYAGTDMELSVCGDAEVQNLYDFLSVDADTNGEFTLDGEIIVDGMMDPTMYDADVYSVIYTVPASNDCGDDTATFEVTILQASEAPAFDDVNICAVLEPTGADLMAGNEDLTFYSDADLTMMVTEGEDLVSGSYYATQRNDSGCESMATEFTVTLTDPGTPTIDNINQTFCEFDEPRISDLNDVIDQTSNVTWFATEDSTDPLNTGIALQTGTYYASLYDPATDCDSAARLAVNVTIERCPLVFPEGISPNGDGLNDTFDIKNIEKEYPRYTIEFFNRWGDSVYKGNANTPDWDGTSNQGSLGGDLLPVGTYFYYLNFNDGSTEPRRGTVYLSR